ncbi:MAG: hypothetical protein GY906_22265 [bacterium]|nr:hypothetical protein [bacterium]
MTPPVTAAEPKVAKRKWVWLEEYKKCHCSNVTELKKDAVGYCPRHGTDRQRINKIPGAGMELGLAEG